MDEGRGETVSELLKVGKGWGGGGVRHPSID